MSATYTLHLDRRASPGDRRALERAVIVRDSFSWGAFLVPALWFFRHGHWLMGLGAALVVVGVAAGLRAAGVGIGAVLVVEVLLHLLIGLEGSTLRLFAYRLRGRPVADVVTAGNMADAEAKAFTRYLERRNSPPSLPPIPAGAFATPFGRREPEPVIGLFPDAERRR